MKNYQYDEILEKRFSSTLSHMIKEGIGYRNENFQGSGIRNLKDIVEYEFYELGNTDIFKTMIKFYKDSIYKYEFPYNVEYLLNYLSKLLDCKTRQLGGIWLTTYQSCIDNYSSEILCENELQKVYIHENKMIPISDLDYDGSLFVYVMKK